jgi:CMP-2-keto-3-deoxyoctulosonic acid synthetase
MIIAGKPMIQRTWEQAKKALLDAVYIATGPCRDRVCMPPRFRRLCDLWD